MQECLSDVLGVLHGYDLFKLVTISSPYLSERQEIWQGDSANNQEAEISAVACGVSEPFGSEMLNGFSCNRKLWGRQGCFLHLSLIHPPLLPLQFLESNKLKERLPRET